MHILKTVFLNSLVQVIGKVITAGSALIISALLARALGQGGFGEFTLMTSYAALFYMAADFGFNGIVLRQAKGQFEELRSRFRSLLGLRLIYSLVLIFIALAILSFLPFSPLLKLATIVTILTIMTQAIFTTANLVFQFKLRYDLSVVAAVVGSLLNLSLIYLLVQGDINLLAVAGCYVVSGVVMALVALGLARTITSTLSPDFNAGRWGQIIFATLPVGLTLVFNLIYFRADVFILSFFKSSADVGIYGSAYKIFEVVLVLPVFFMNALYPHLVSTYEGNRDQFRQMVRWSIIGLTGSSVFGAALGIMLAPGIVRLIYGDSFGEAVIPLQVLLASAPIYYLSSLYMWLLILLRRQKTMALVYGLGMMLNIALNIYFVPIYSYVAAAIITGVSEAVILLLTFYLSRDWKYDQASN